MNMAGGAEDWICNIFSQHIGLYWDHRSSELSRWKWPFTIFFLIPKKKRPTTNSCMLIKKLLSNKLLLSPTNVLQHEQRHRWGHSDWWNEALPSPKRPGRRGSHLVWSWHLMGYVTGVILEKSARRCTWWEGWEDGPHGMAAPRALYLTAK